MYDPLTVAFEIRYPWKSRSEIPGGYRRVFITIWHVDPEKGGDEASCWRDKTFGWQGWRFHFWHWRLQIHPIQNLKRWLFSRCAGCGKRFSWGYSPVTKQWGGPGPRWFHGEVGKYHYDCYPPIETPDEFTSDGAPQKF